MERIGSLISQKELEEKFGKADELNPRIRFSKVLLPATQIEFTDEHLRNHFFDFEMAREDLKACYACTGQKCIASVASGKFKGFFALCIEDSYTYKQPRFRVYACHDAAERKRRISEMLATSGKVTKLPRRDHQ